MGTTDIKECAGNEPEIQRVLYSHSFLFHENLLVKIFRDRTNHIDQAQLQH